MPKSEEAKPRLDDFVFSIGSIHLSDLFFNHDLTKYRELYDRKTEAEKIDEQEIRDALAEDADQFLACLPKQTPQEHERCVTALVDDFLHRV